ncbi:carbohydrate ABC transporter permease [Phytoactinopolyspora halotolerans]|uniref:Carbohydrate ABC transporter permease n=1 Tax=Phytoactinopolyspora halotolerans TaxID=1981512 RepID=A0A6L9SF53_9ACTN|nr:carbohydrate ABC transporter permease [Phytoactinopolyspora halotolerans]NEE03294.1 carbohydrate ABC transporter permease [Phytoactinopolyspora halotolerans]
MREGPAFRWFRRAGLTFLTLFTVLPLYVVVSSSIKPLADVEGTFSWIPERVTLAPYLDAWTTVPLARYVANTLVVSLASAALSLPVAVLAAYALARFAFAGRRAFRLVVLSTQMVPGILFLVPLFLLFTQVHAWFGVELVGSRPGLVITFLTFSLPLSIWMLTGYLAGLPREIEEAAMVDGLGYVGVVWRIVVPLATPAIVAVGVFAFIIGWGEVLFASVLTDSETRTLSIGLRGFASESTVQWNQLMAAAVLASLPVVLGFLLLQRHLMRGLASGLAP